MKIGIIASGGNAPGMNNAIIGFAKCALAAGYEPYVVYDGYKGLITNEIEKADIRLLENFIARGNIFIRTSRFPEFKDESIRQKAVENLHKHRINKLFICGGDGSYQGAEKLSKLGVECIATPGTIDNDISSTDYTIGFDSCLNFLTKTIDQLRNCFESHTGVFIVECMGRRWPDLTIESAIGCNAEYIITAENIITPDKFVEVVNTVMNKNGKKSCVFVVSEKLYGQDGHDTLTNIAKHIEEQTGFFTRAKLVCYDQRGAEPTARDRFMANIMAKYAVDLFLQNDHGYAIGYRNGQLIKTKLNEAINLTKTSEHQKQVDEYNKIMTAK